MKNPLMSCFSYAMFTVNKEKKNAITIITGNLMGQLKVDEEIKDTLEVPANSTKTFTVELSNLNTRKARYNFYYKGSLPDDVTIIYEIEDGVNIPPTASGINLEKSGTSGSSNVYKITVENRSTGNVTIPLGYEVGLDYNDLTIPEDGHLIEQLPVKGTLATEVLLADSANSINRDDPKQTFITGENPNNYIWYSGKLWRAVSIDPADNSVKLVTQWGLTAISYHDSSSSFEGSHMKMWLNDTTVDGFLGNLRSPQKFIKMDSKWNATTSTDSLGSITRPDDENGTIVESAVGLLNSYEYQMSYSGTTAEKGYLEDGISWWILTPYEQGQVWYVAPGGGSHPIDIIKSNAVRPSINLKPNIRIISGEGTEVNPYRITGDSDTPASGTLLSTRYSGEYIRFGAGENNLYRIVSHENGSGVKIVSNESLKEGGNPIVKWVGTLAGGLGDDNTQCDNPYDGENSVCDLAYFLNHDYLDTTKGYLTSEQINMIEDTASWYVGTVNNGENYRLSKYADVAMTSLTTSISGKAWLLRLGELLELNREEKSWTLTPATSNNLWHIGRSGLEMAGYSPGNFELRPSMNLKSGVKITGGNGTKEAPFEISL